MKRFRIFLSVLSFVCLGLATVAIRPAYADDAMERARSHYEMGIQLFEARQPEQALLEFQRANELKPRPAAVFMMAQCEYLTGALKDARAHYEQYVAQSPEGEFVELAKDRILAISRRPGVLVVNSTPDQIDVRIEPSGGGKPVASGQAPNNFSIPRGKYVVVASKPNFVTERREIEIDLAETKPVFFKLEPIPARLEIWTDPPNATLYVNGNRARNPFLQDVPPGKYEVYAECPDYHARTDEISVGPGQKKVFEREKTPFQLRYVQRSGRPELIAASTIMGAVWGLGAVFVLMNPDIFKNDQGSSFPLTPMLGGAVSAGVAGGLISNAVLPSYIKDNRALWLIGGMGYGGAEGVGLGLLIGTSSLMTYPSFRPALYGSLIGFAVGTTGTALLADKAPNYGRVALVESAGFGGALAGALAGVPLDSLASKRTIIDENGKPKTLSNSYMVVKYAFPMMIGMNLALAGSLTYVYMSDQTKYGPSWQRVVLVDLAAAAGSVVGLTASALTRKDCRDDASNCTVQFPKDTSSALFTLGGGITGIVAGILLTRNFDNDRKEHLETAPPSSASWVPVPSVLPVDTGHGMAAVPGLMSVGQF